MNYIVFDLEWNQSPGGKKYSNHKIFQQIRSLFYKKTNFVNHLNRRHHDFTYYSYRYFRLQHHCVQ